MKELLDKVGQYQLFNYLFPGVVFAAILKKIGSYDLIGDNLIVAAFVCYFAGMVISRVGSLLVGPALRELGVLRFKPYPEFIKASRKDPKLDTLSQENNTYRTITAMFLMVGVAKLYEWVGSICCCLDGWKIIIVGVLLLALFIFAYRKQTHLITKRIEANLEDE